MSEPNSNLIFNKTLKDIIMKETYVKPSLKPTEFDTRTSCVLMSLPPSGPPAPPTPPPAQDF